MAKSLTVINNARRTGSNSMSYDAKHKNQQITVRPIRAALRQVIGTKPEHLRLRSRIRRLSSLSRPQILCELFAIGFRF